MKKGRRKVARSTIKIPVSRKKRNEIIKLWAIEGDERDKVARLKKELRPSFKDCTTPCFLQRHFSTPNPILRATTRKTVIKRNFWSEKKEAPSFVFPLKKKNLPYLFLRGKKEKKRKKTIITVDPLWQCNKNSDIALRLLSILELSPSINVSVYNNLKFKF